MNFFRLFSVSVLLFVLAACGQREESVSPSLYLLNHGQWTANLVVNFNAAVAPFDSIGKTLEHPPRLEPALEGEWQWEDPSRLVFIPKYQTFQPESQVKVSLQGVVLREGYRFGVLNLNYKTPPLKIDRLKCEWQDILEAPMRRRLEASFEFNYPLYRPPFAATIGANALPLPNGIYYGSHFTVRSEPLLRPAQDTVLNFTLNSGNVHLLARSPQSESVAGAQVALATGAECQLAAQRGAWDKIEEEKPQPPTVTDIDLQLGGGKLNVSLHGVNLVESAKKTHAGEPVKSGVSISPPIEGVWMYGESAQGPDLIFTPTDPKSLKPGSRYEITLYPAVFPDLKFAYPKLGIQFDTPAMSGSISNFQLYSDPQAPRAKRLTATLDFNYPLQQESLAAKLAVLLRVEPVKSFTDSRVRRIPFELSYDADNPNRAYLKTVPIPIPDEPGEAQVSASGVLSTWGGAGSREIRDRFAIPSVQDYFHITDADASSVIKPDGSIERLFVFHSTTPLQNPATLAQAVEAYLLPDCADPAAHALCEEKSIAEWQAEQVDAATLKLSTAVPLTWRDPGQDDKTLQYLVFQAPEKRQVFINVKHGLESVDGFKLAKDARFVFQTGENQRELKILHEGALLSLTGSKKLGVAVRGVPKVHVRLQRVLPHNMHHFAEFTRGEFQNPSFRLSLEHFAETFGYDETMPPTKEEMERQYFAVDFARFAQTKGYPPRGLFLLSVAEKKEKPKPCASGESAEPTDVSADSEEANPEAAAPTGESADSEEATADCTPVTETDEATQTDDEASGGIEDRRLVLLTDLGLLVKTGADGHQDVFVMSFRSGQPVAGVQVSLLGKNGVALFSAKTDAQGRAGFASAKDLKDEKAPSVYLAEKDGDLSFLPFSRDNRLMDVSRFDIDGLHDAADSLHAFVFSDRGIYRPGDTAHIGLILRKRDWSALPAGLPLKAVITDPEDQEIFSKTVAFGKEGFEELQWASSESGKTGSYRVELFLAEKTQDGKTKQKSLGQTVIRVEEFQPDRLQVKTEIENAPATGWLKPDGAKANITVRNLFGTAAAGNPAKLEMTLRPWLGTVPGFTDYHFRGSIGAAIPNLPQELGEATTDAQGVAHFDLPLANIAEPVFELTLAGEGFEKGSGRSVVNVTTALVSKLALLLGYKADGALDYVSKGGKRELSLIAVGPDFKPQDSAALSAELFETRYVSTLVKREDGLYSYQSVQRDALRKTLPVTLASGKAVFPLPTEDPGNFYIVFKNGAGEELNRVAYSVAGDGDISRSLERNAELNLTLDKKEYQPGETVAVQIVAPYQGAGLLTIEQDGVVASQWFKTQGSASTQHITLPKTISGNAYLSVAFVRSLDSKEIYMSPLSYGVVPFTLSRQAFTQNLTLEVPEKVRPGTNLDINYTVKEPTKLVLYAVDEGILQFAHYRNPAPLDFFFRKRALQTKTHQILDLILPDYALVQKLAAPGGDEDAETFGKYKNPFARKHKPPMAFWSGIVDALPGTHTVSVPVPDYFNGSIRVLAVAVNAGKLATPVSRSVASNPYVIQAQQPLVVAPGDEFDIGVLVANATGEAGEKTLEVTVAAGDALELATPAAQTLKLGPGQDGTVRFKAKAKPKLGPVAVRYQVSGAGKEASYSEEMGIRPSQPLLTTSQNGVLHIIDQQAGKSASLDFKRTVYDEQQFAEIAVSMTPSAYLRGIVEYLKHYPYGCTEQLVSQAFPAVVLGGNTELGLSDEDVNLMFGRTLKILQSRLKHDGSFGLWSVSSRVDPVYSMYATHLLFEARERGFKVPDALFKSAIGFADQYTQETHYQWHEHEAQAYALYLLSRNGQNVADRLHKLEAELQRQWGEGGAMANWTRLFLGAAYKIHHLDQDADRFYGEFQREWKKTGLIPWNLQNYTQDMSLYLYLANAHFSDQLDAQDPLFGRYLLELGQDLVKQRSNSFQGAWALLGLGSLWNRFDQEEGKAYHITAGKPPMPLDLLGKTVKHAVLQRDASPIGIGGDGLFNLYYQLTERGYDKATPTTAINQGITINRWLLNEKGEEATELDMQDKLHIRLALHPDKPMQNIAVVMLVPGGFEIDLDEEGLGSRQSLPIAGKPIWTPEYIDVQEDRVVFFGDFDSGEKYFEFRLKPLNSGVYTVPPAFAEGMYDTGISHRGLAGSIRVKE